MWETPLAVGPGEQSIKMSVCGTFLAVGPGEQSIKMSVSVCVKLF